MPGTIDSVTPINLTDLDPLYVNFTLPEQTRAEVQQLHDNPPTELVGLDGFLTATPSPARRLSLTDATRQGD